MFKTYILASANAAAMSVSSPAISGGNVSSCNFKPIDQPANAADDGDGTWAITRKGKGHWKQ